MPAVRPPSRAVRAQAARGSAQGSGPSGPQAEPVSARRARRPRTAGATSASCTTLGSDQSELAFVGQLEHAAGRGQGLGDVGAPRTAFDDRESAERPARRSRSRRWPGRGGPPGDAARRAGEVEGKERRSSSVATICGVDSAAGRRRTAAGHGRAPRSPAPAARRGRGGRCRRRAIARRARRRAGTGSPPGATPPTGEPMAHRLGRNRARRRPSWLGVHFNREARP